MFGLADGEAGQGQPVQHAGDAKERQQQGQDAAGTHPVEAAHVDGAELPVLLQHAPGDQEAADDEEAVHRRIAAEAQQAHQAPAEPVAHRCRRQRQAKAQAQVVGDHQQDRQPAQHIDGTVAGDIHGVSARRGRCHRRAWLAASRSCRSGCSRGSLMATESTRSGRAPHVSVRRRTGLKRRGRVHRCVDIDPQGNDRLPAWLPGTCFLSRAGGDPCVFFREAA